jgi:hypothetical protein
MIAAAAVWLGVALLCGYIVGSIFHERDHDEPVE